MVDCAPCFIERLGVVLSFVTIWVTTKRRASNSCPRLRVDDREQPVGIVPRLIVYWPATGVAVAIARYKPSVGRMSGGGVRYVVSPTGPPRGD